MQTVVARQLQGQELEADLSQLDVAKCASLAGDERVATTPRPL